MLALALASLGPAVSRGPGPSSAVSTDSFCRIVRSLCLSYSLSLERPVGMASAVRVDGKEAHTHECTHASACVPAGMQAVVQAVAVALARGITDRELLDDR